VVIALGCCAVHPPASSWVDDERAAGEGTASVKRVGPRSSGQGAESLFLGRERDTILASLSIRLFEVEVKTRLARKACNLVLLERFPSSGMPSPLAGAIQGSGRFTPSIPRPTRRPFSFSSSAVPRLHRCLFKYRFSSRALCLCMLPSDICVLGCEADLNCGRRASGWTALDSPGQQMLPVQSESVWTDPSQHITLRAPWWTAA
jgi:hypothetical protein